MSQPVPPAIVSTAASIMYSIKAGHPVNPQDAEILARYVVDTAGASRAIAERVRIQADLILDLVKNPGHGDCGEPYRSRLKALAANVQWLLGAQCMPHQHSKIRSVLIIDRDTGDVQNLLHHSAIQLAFAKLEPA